MSGCPLSSCRLYVPAARLILQPTQVHFVVTLSSAVLALLHDFPDGKESLLRKPEVACVSGRTENTSRHPL
jgi:uroporphyrinogen-III synthase